MAINFPDSPTNGQTYTDSGTGQTWTYELATNSWTASSLAVTGGVVYKGSVDITAAPPTGAKSGEQWSVDTGGTANAGYGPGVTGTITKGSMVMYTGTDWLETSHSVPDATVAAKGIVQLADAAAITNGGVGRVVDAAQLKAAQAAASGSATAPTAPAAGQVWVDSSVTPSVIKVWSGTAWIPQVGATVTSATAPAAPTAGQMWVDTSASPNVTKIWDGTKWVTATPDGAATAALANDAKYATKAELATENTWDRTGTVLTPANANDSVTLPFLAGTSIANVIVDTFGALKRQALPFSWDANDDSYTRTAVADRSILVQARVKRCLVTDAGVVTYLDADDSTKLAGDWVRLVETTDLDTPYTGTHQAEQANTELRALASAWKAGTFTKGALVSNGGFVWECVAATTTATPAAGAAAATLDGTAGQVMVEIPLFSVKHQTERNGTYKRHEFAVAPGAQTTGGFAVHPAFIKPDGSYRDFTYVGAYQGTGTGGNGSASGVNNTVNMTRAACRTACSGRGVGWHQLGYWENNALQWLLITEYQDMNSQKVLGNGASTGGAFVVPTGLSNARGNRSGNAHTVAGANTDYVSYRGVENFYGRAWQWIDGINISERNVYVSGDPSKWADNTAANYVAIGQVPSGSASYQRDLMSGAALLPSSVTGASGTTFTGDALWTNSGWRVASAGGGAGSGTPVGALCVNLNRDSSVANPSIGGRLSYAV